MASCCEPDEPVRPVVGVVHRSVLWGTAIELLLRFVIWEPVVECFEPKYSLK